MSKIHIELGELENSCFVVMPFNTLFQTEYDKIIQPALQELNVRCIRGDEIYSKQRIVDDIWNSIRSCRFVLAELTGKNPNVLYEIGLAHAIGKPVIILTRNAEDVPFDLKALRYLFYDVNDPFWGDNLKIGIQSLVKKVLENPGIEVYLEGIKSESLAFPSIKSSKPNNKERKEKISDVSGTWTGKFDDSGITNVTLQIDQSESILKGIAIMTFVHGSAQSVVQQLMNGTVKKNMVELHGVNYTFLERGKASDYTLDTFKVKYEEQTEALTGEVISITSKGNFKADLVLKRVVVT